MASPFPASTAVAAITTGAIALSQSGSSGGEIGGGGDTSGSGGGLTGGSSDLSVSEDGSWEGMRPIIEATGLGFLSFTGKKAIRAKIPRSPEG